MIPNARHRVSIVTRQRAKELRRTMSLAEQMMWAALREMRKPTGFKFRHQQPIDPYIVDFVCFGIKLVVELDGSSHDTTQVYDQKRTDYLNKLGYKVVRFMNEDVLENLEGVIQALYSDAQSLVERTPPLTPPSRGGERWVRKRE